MSLRAKLIIRFLIPWLVITAAGWAVFNSFFSANTDWAIAGMFFTKAFSIINALLFFMLLLAQKHQLNGKNEKNLGMFFLVVGIKFLLSLAVMAIYIYLKKTVGTAEVVVMLGLYVIYTVSLMFTMMKEQ
jgi:hypothetical protein